MFDIISSRPNSREIAPVIQLVPIFPKYFDYLVIQMMVVLPAVILLIQAFMRKTKTSEKILAAESEVEENAPSMNDEILNKSRELQMKVRPFLPV